MNSIQMSNQEALQTIWDYMHMQQPLSTADAILVFGSRDTTPAHRAAELFLAGYAPVIVCVGSGSVNNHKPGREQFIGTTEAALMKEVLLEDGVPEEAILLEDKSQNTGQNYEYSVKVLHEAGIKADTLIIVHKPYMERRTYATGKVWLPDTNMLVTSEQISLEQYQARQEDEVWIHTMVGDLQRIREYPKRGFQIEQEIPERVWQAYEYLVVAGYTKRLIAE